MIHKFTEVLLAAYAISSILYGCAIGDGSAMAEAEFSLDAHLAADQTRVKDNIYTTADGSQIRMNTLKLTLSKIELISQTAVGGSGSAAFDPSAPPEGYTACHNGHCHIIGASGTKTYEEIEAEMNGGSIEKKTVASVNVGKEIVFSSLGQILPTMESFASADLDSGSINLISYTFSQFVFDGRNETSGKSINVSNTHVHEDGTAHLEEMVLSHPIDLKIGKKSDSRQELHFILEIDGAFLDALSGADDSSSVDFYDVLSAHSAMEPADEEHHHEGE